MRFSICLIEPDGYRFSHFLYDSCKFLCYTIEANGYDCCMVKNKFYHDRVNIILGSHNLTDPATVETIKSIGKYIIVQSEVLREGGISGWQNQVSYKKIYLPLMRNAIAVWDGMESNQIYLRQAGINAEIIPHFGYLPALQEVIHKKNKDIDFLYYGSLTPHRKKQIDALTRLGARVVCIFDEAAIFRNDYIARTRINLAPNQSPENDHITSRILYLLNNRSIVVVENCRDQVWIEHCFLSADTDRWADLCMETLYRPDLDELADTSFENYKKLDMTALFQPLLDKLADKIPGGRRAVPTAGAADRPPAAIAKSDKTVANNTQPEIPEPFARLDALLQDQKTVEAIQAFTDVECHEKPKETTFKEIDAIQQFDKQHIPDLTSIIILTHNTLDLTKKCLKNIRAHTPEPHEVIFVAGGASGKTVKWLYGQIRENNNYHLVEAQQKDSIAGKINRGISLSRGEYILLLTDDVLVGPDWLKGMTACLNMAPDAGIIGPMADKADGIQKIGDSLDCTADRLDSYPLSFREKHLNRRIPCRNLADFCLLFRRQLVEKIGLLDERFTTADFGVEDFCLRVALKDHTNYIAGDVFVFNREEEKTPSQRSTIEKKWTLTTASSEGRELLVLKTRELAADLQAKGKTDQAIEALIDCIKIIPDHASIYYEMIRIFLELKKFSEAWEVVASMPEQAREALKGLEFAAYIKEGLDLDDDAAGYADRMIGLDADYAPALNLKGVLAYKKGEEDQAADYFKKAITSDPGFGEAYTNLGVVHWRAGKNEDAFSSLRKGFNLSPAVPDTGALYYSVVSALDRFSEAEADFQEARMLFPHNKSVAFLYIDVLLQQGKLHAAMVKIEDALAVFGLDEGMLRAALDVREKIGPRRIDPVAKTGSLSLCMIVKNEEQHLVRCLHSVRDVVDEMIVVDTGSSDKTKDIAAVFGAKVFDFPWTGDFSEARNHSLKQATGDWILILDADEVIAMCDHDELRVLIRKGAPTPAAYYIMTRNYLQNANIVGWTRNSGQCIEEAGVGWVRSDKVRLFTRTNNVWFVNPVHEMVEESLRQIKIPIYPCKIVVHHYGKLDMEKELIKGEEYYFLGKKKYERNPDNVLYIHELAKAAQVIGKYGEAAELWLKLISLLEANPQDYQDICRVSYSEPISEIYIQLASAYLLMDRYAEALAAARNTVKTKTRVKEYVNIYAHLEIVAGSLVKASSALEELFEDCPDYTPALFLQAVIFCLEGNIAKALDKFEVLLQHHVQLTPLLNKIAKQLKMNAKSAEALLVLNAAIKNKLGDEETANLLGELRQSEA